MIDIEIPNTKEKIEKQILALEWQVEHDVDDKDREIHHKTLHKLRKALSEFK